MSWTMQQTFWGLPNSWAPSSEMRSKKTFWYAIEYELILPKIDINIEKKEVGYLRIRYKGSLEKQRRAVDGCSTCLWTNPNAPNAPGSKSPHAHQTFSVSLSGQGSTALQCIHHHHHRFLYIYTERETYDDACVVIGRSSQGFVILDSTVCGVDWCRYFNTADVELRHAAFEQEKITEKRLTTIIREHVPLDSTSAVDRRAANLASQLGSRGGTTIIIFNCIVTPWIQNKNIKHSMHMRIYCRTNHTCEDDSEEDITHHHPRLGHVQWKASIRSLHRSGVLRTLLSYHMDTYRQG